MNAGKVICMTSYNRPQYFRRVLEALSRCTGVENYVLVACIEPGNEENRALVEAVDFAECRPIFNRRKLGCTANTHQAFSKGFQLADFVILVEDDVLLARDAITYLEFCRRRYIDDQNVLSVAAYNRSKSCDPESYHEICRRQHFTPWAIGFWRERWQLIAPGWLRERRVSWDVRLTHEFCQKRGLYAIYPQLSRAQNIGAEGGTYCPGAEWHRQNQHVPLWTEDIDMPRGEFWERES